MNFLSNVVFRRSSWAENVDRYIEHCLSYDWFSDTVTAAGYMFVWADFLVGKRVGLLAAPLVIGFVAQQAVLRRLLTLNHVFFLDVSPHFLRLGADAYSVRCYQRSIYKHGSDIAELVLSEDPYTRRHFSMRVLVGRYGDDPALWETFHDAVLVAAGHRSKLKVFGSIVAAALLCPRRWRALAGFMARELKGQAWRLRRRSPQEARPDYEKHMQQLDAGAEGYARRALGLQGKLKISHPVYLKGTQYIQIGDAFGAGPGLRMECWDRYQGQTYSPSLVIGDRVSFGFWCHVGCINRIRIGDNVLVGSGVLITDHQHGRTDADAAGGSWRDQPLHSKGGVVIEDNVWIGEHACIMPGVRIGMGAVIGANAVVTRDVPAGAVVGGIPARTIRQVGDTDGEVDHASR